MKEQIRENIKKDKYTPKKEFNQKFYLEDHVFNEDESVKWNREKVKTENEKLKINVESYQKKLEEGLNQFKEDIVNLISTKYNLGINDSMTKEIALLLFNKAYEDYSGTGYLEGVLDDSVELAQLAEKMIALTKAHIELIENRHIDIQDNLCYN